MLSKNSRLLWMILVALAVTVTTPAQQDNPLETIKIDTNLVVLRVVVNDKPQLEHCADFDRWMTPLFESEE